MFLGFTLAQWLSFGFVSVVINVALTSITFAFRSRRKAMALLSAIDFEFRFARQLCTAYKKDSADGTKAWAPAYRLSIKALEEGVPFLRDHGFLFPMEADELARLVLRMEEVNHCLGLVEEGVKKHGGDVKAALPFIGPQSSRCARKCDHVLQQESPNNEDGTLPGAEDVLKVVRYRVQRYLRPLWLYRTGTASA
jgi:hypothetical protein